MRKDRHHIKNVQKKMIRSARNEEDVAQRKKLNQDNQNKEENISAEKELYDEFIPANQQVPRVPNRITYH